MCLDLSFLLALYILFFSFFFFKSLPVIILSLDQSSIDQSNGSSIDPSTFFFFISSLFICIVFFFVPSPSFPSVCPYYILLSSCICISLLEGVHLFSKKQLSLVFYCSIRICSALLFVLSSTGINTKQLVSLQTTRNFFFHIEFIDLKTRFYESFQFMGCDCWDSCVVVILEYLVLAQMSTN